MMKPYLLVNKYFLTISCSQQVFLPSTNLHLDLHRPDIRLIQLVTVHEHMLM